MKYPVPSALQACKAISFEFGGPGRILPGCRCPVFFCKDHLKLSLIDIISGSLSLLFGA